MKHTKMNIVNAFTSLDEMMQHGNGPIMLLSPQQMFEMGQFYEMAKPIVNDDEANLDDEVEVEDEIEWVVGETQSWRIE